MHLVFDPFDGLLITHLMFVNVNLIINILKEKQGIILFYFFLKRFLPLGGFLEKVIIERVFSIGQIQFDGEVKYNLIGKKKLIAFLYFVRKFVVFSFYLMYMCLIS